MRRLDKEKALQTLSRVWRGQSNVLAGKQAEEKMISILKNKFPKAELIEVNDISGNSSISISNLNVFKYFFV